jgi:hypothetical protein
LGRLQVSVSRGRIRFPRPEWFLGAAPAYLAFRAVDKRFSVVTLSTGNRL